MYQTTTALRKILPLKQRIRVIQGGTSAGKTIAIVMRLIDWAQREKVSISVVSESLPHLKRGAMKDFLNIMREHNYFSDAQWNRSDFIYTFETGSTMEFFGADSPDKVRGPRRDVLFINECNNIPYGVYDQLEVRTRLAILLDFNPVGEFWVHSEVMTEANTYDFVKLTYKDNEALDPAIVASIESRKHNENWWRVYGLGEVGYNEGQILTNWSIIPKVPKDARLERFGLDFGYAVDPSALGAVYKWNNAYVVDELLYRKGMSNKQLADVIIGQEKPKILTIADSAEPKSIDEIKSFGVNIVGCVKGPDSVNHGIQLMQDQRFYITQRSVNIIKDLRNYLWKTDRMGTTLNVPAHEFSHSPDMIRYVISDLLKTNNYVFRVRST